MKVAMLFRSNNANLLVLFGLLSITACHKRVVVSSFTTIPLQCSLREPKSKQQQLQFKIPQIPFFNNDNILSTNGNSKVNHGPSKSSSSPSPASSYHQLKSQIENQGAKLSKQDGNDYATTENSSSGISDNNNSNGNGDTNDDNIKILQNRSAIMGHALQFKSKELETLDRRNTLLQDVVKKLQVSNRNLLDKVHQLQHEKEGMHISTDSGEDELWPPEMEMEVLRDEFNSKEMEWENALETAQWKYTRLRDEYLNVQMKLQELMQEISDAGEKALYYEERAAFDDSEITTLRATIEEKEELIGTLKSKEVKVDDEKAKNYNKMMENKLEELEEKVADLEAQNDKAKVFIQDLRVMSKEKRESIQQIVMNERQKNRNTINNLKFTQAENIDLKTELKKTTDDLQNLRVQAKNAAKKSKLRQEEVEEQLNSVKQAESREHQLKKKLENIENKLDRKTQENLTLGAKIEELESEIEQAMTQNMDSTAKENDWLNQINELEVELLKAKDSRDVLCRRELRLRQALEDDKQRHLCQISTNKEAWEKKMLAQKMEFELSISELRTEITSYNDTINQQEMKIDELSAPPQESASGIADVSTSSSAGTNTSKRFQRIRKRVRKMKEWLRS